MRKIILLVMMLLTLTGCRGEGEYHPPETTTHEYTPEETTPQPTEATTTLYKTMIYEPSIQINWNVQVLTSASMRVQIASDDAWYGMPNHVLFDLSQIGTYHEHIIFEDGVRFVFTAEASVRNFRLLRLVWEGDEGYFISEVLYTLDELTPAMPFVVTGISMGGSALANSGFSFVDENGTAHYFALHRSGYHGDSHPINIKKF